MRSHVLLCVLLLLAVNLPHSVLAHRHIKYLWYVFRNALTLTQSHTHAHLQTHLQAHVSLYTINIDLAFVCAFNMSCRTSPTKVFNIAFLPLFLSLFHSIPYALSLCWTFDCQAASMLTTKKLLKLLQNAYIRVMYNRTTRTTTTTTLNMLANESELVLCTNHKH